MNIVNELKKQFFELYLEREKRFSEECLKYYNNIESKIKNVKEHKKQIEFHQCQKRIRWIFGGNRTGKTVAGAVETVWFARGNHPFKNIRHATRGWVISLTGEVQRDVAQREILKWIDPKWIKKVIVRKGSISDPENSVIDFIVIENIFGTESVIGFKACEQGREKFQGASQDYIWFDEEPPKDIFDECKMRVVDKKGEIWGTMTPLKGLTWVYDDIYLNKNNDDEIKYFFLEWVDNPYLSQSEIKRMESVMSEEELEMRKFGRFVSVSGLVYKDFDEEIHVIDPFDIDCDWQDNISIDPGLEAPLSCHFYARDGDNNIYVVAEHYQNGLSVEEHSKEIFKIADELCWKRNHSGLLEALIDSAADQKTLASEKSVAELFKRHHIYVTTRVNKSKWAGIQKVREYLKPRESIDKQRYPKKRPKLFIFKTCINLIREFKTYRFKPGCDEPYKKDDHALDELRYYIMSLNDDVRKRKNPASENDIARHKNAVLKRIGHRRG